MKKFLNGQYVEMTTEECLALQEEQNSARVLEQHRPYSPEEALRFLLRKQLNTLDVDDQVSVRMADFYPSWEELAGQSTKQAGFKFTYGGKLYKTLSPNHTFASEWVPGIGTESLYKRIDEEYAGNLYDPIPYDGNMELTQGLYYTQHGSVYQCIRDTDAPVYNPLKELVGLYLTLAQ